MNDIDRRLETLEDRAALEAVLLRYYHAVDTLSDLDTLVDCFTPDAVFDVEDLGLAVYRGHDAIRAFFKEVFEHTPHHCHHVSNFDVTRLEGDTASARGYVIGRANGANGVKVFVHCCYAIEYLRTPQGWKMSVFDEDTLMPLGDEVRELHG